MRPAAIVLALSLLACAIPAAAQTAEEDYQAGVAARLAGDFREALRRLGRAVAAEPGNADIHLQIGLTHLGLGELDAAEAGLRRTLELAPDYDDARLGLARVALRRGDTAAAIAEIDQVRRPTAEAADLRRRIEAAAALRRPEAVGERRPEVRAVEPITPWAWRADLEGTYTDVEHGPDWQGSALAVQHRISPGTIVAAIVEATRRFSRNDVYGEGRVVQRIAPGSTLYLLMGGSPGADYRPNWQIGAGVSVRARGGPYATILRLDARQADYPSGDVQTVTPGVEQYVGGNAWITGQWIQVWDRFNHSSGWLARGDIFVTERLRLFAGVADAPDLSEGVVIETFSLFGGAWLDLNDRTTLRLSFASDDVEFGNDRRGVSLGLGLRF